MVFPHWKHLLNTANLPFSAKHTKQMIRFLPKNAPYGTLREAFLQKTAIRESLSGNKLIPLSVIKSPYRLTLRAQPFSATARPFPSIEQ